MGPVAESCAVARVKLALHLMSGSAANAICGGDPHRAPLEARAHARDQIDSRGAREISFFTRNLESYGEKAHWKPRALKTYDQRRGPVMNVRENVHQLIDALPEERLADVRDYIADLQGGDTALDSATAAAVEEGLDDIRNGRTISLADYQRTRGL
jgi:hypothetical protein